MLEGTALALETTSYLSHLLEKNREFIEVYKKNPLIQIVNSQDIVDKNKRYRLLDCIQTFSDYFQKVVMLRYVFCEDKKFFSVTQEHLKEEFGHNFLLMADRDDRPPFWDSILDAQAAWFAWKMLTLNQEEKTVLMHLVLEASANIFFREAHMIMQKYKETDYFKTHAEVDEEHEKMGVQLLQNIDEDRFRRLLEVQQKGWEVLNSICERIAYLTSQA